MTSIYWKFTSAITKCLEYFLAHYRYSINISNKWINSSTNEWMNTELCGKYFTSSILWNPHNNPIKWSFTNAFSEAETLRIIMWWHRHYNLDIRHFCLFFLFYSHACAFIAQELNIGVEWTKKYVQGIHTHTHTHVRPERAAFVGESSETRTEMNVQVPIKRSDLADPEVRFYEWYLKFGLCDF